MTEGLIRTLDASSRFRRDGRISGIFHPGSISYRELSPRESLHIIIDGGRVSAHVDDVCPLRCRPDGSVRFSWGLVIAHNLSGLVSDLGRRVRGKHGQQRCNLGCEMVWVDDDSSIADLIADRECRSSGHGAGSEGTV